MSTDDRIPNQPLRPPTGSGSSRRRRGRILAGAAGALVLTTGLGGVALARTSTGTTRAAEPTSQTEAAASADLRAGRSVTDIDELTLAELSEELERLGLEVRVAPGDTGVEPDAGRSDGDVDPFEGMTDAEIDALSDEEFFELLEEVGIEPDWVDADEQDGVDTGHDGEEEPLGTAEIDGDRIDTTGLSPEVAAQATAIWSRFVELIPADQRQMVTGFELLDEDYRGAHVYPDEVDPTKWVLGVGLGLGEDLDDVLIHEFAHLLTLRAEEVPPSDHDGACPTYHTGEGCALRGSTMAEFVKRFWPRDMRDAIEELYASEDEAAFDAFYQERKDQFVTDYAATNPAEDLAETFAHFVTEDRPTGDTIADQKVQLLWADPDLVELRTQIRSALG